MEFHDEVGATQIVGKLGSMNVSLIRNYCSTHRKLLMGSRKVIETAFNRFHVEIRVQSLQPFILFANFGQLVVDHHQSAITNCTQELIIVKVHEAYPRKSLTSFSILSTAFLTTSLPSSHCTVTLSTIAIMRWVTLSCNSLTCF